MVIETKPVFTALTKKDKELYLVRLHYEDKLLQSACALGHVGGCMHYRGLGFQLLAKSGIMART